MPEEVTTDARQRSSGSSPTDGHDTDRVVGALEVSVAVALGGAFLVGVVAAFGQGWVPASDDALMALQVRDVPGDLPLVGQYSRFGWSHPGPTAYYFLAVPYRLLGSSPGALMVGPLLLGFGGTIWAWLVARRQSRLLGALVLLAMTLVMLGRDAVDLRDPWNPYVGVLLAGTLVVLACSAAERSAGSAFALLPLGTFLVQAHVGYVPLVVCVVVAATAGALAADIPAGPGSFGRKPFPSWPALAGLGIAAVMWIPPLVEQVSNDPGNLSQLISSITDDGDVAGVTTATKLVLSAFAVPPSWLGRELPVLTRGVDPVWTVPLLMLVPVGAAVVAAMRRNGPPVRSMVVGWAGVAGAALGISQITGPVHEYLFSGLGAVAAVVIALGLWVLLDAFANDRIKRYVMLGALGAVVVAAIPVAWAQTGVDGPYPSTARSVSVISPALLDDAGDDPVFIEAVPEFTAFAALPGFVLALERAGIDVAVPDGTAREFGEHRTGSPDGRIRYLVAFPGAVSRYVRDGWTLVGEYDPLPAEASASLAELDAEVIGLYEQRSELAEEGLDTSALDRRIDDNREQSYDLRAERFPLAVLRAPG